MVTTPPGVQNERTALAWQRTALSLAVASAAWNRLSHGWLVGDALTALVAVVVGWVFIESRWRYHHDAGLRRRRRERGGRAPALLALVTVVLGSGELVSLATGR